MNATELKAKIEKVMEVTGKTQEQITELMLAKDSWTWTLIRHANV